MTKIKTARAWGFVLSGTPVIMDKYDGAEPVVIVHGLTEAEVHEAAALLEKSLEVCEWGYSLGEFMPPSECKTQSVFLGDAPNYCPSCGRKVVVE